MDDVQRAVVAATNLTSQFVLMQCNTNYTGSLENFKYIQLNVLRSFQAMYPKLILGLRTIRQGIRPCWVPSPWVHASSKNTSLTMSIALGLITRFQWTLNHRKK